MIESLKKVFGLGSPVDYAALHKRGAVIVDVRTKGEYSTGHIKGSVNIPIDQLTNSLSRLPDKNIDIITCCASGARSASAKGILTSNGYLNVHNGGSWISLQNRI